MTQPTFTFVGSFSITGISDLPPTLDYPTLRIEFEGNFSLSNWLPAGKIYRLASLTGEPPTIAENRMIFLQQPTLILWSGLELPYTLKFQPAEFFSTTPLTISVYGSYSRAGATLETPRLDFKSYAIVELPPANTHNGQIAIASDARWSGGIGSLVRSNGTNWLDQDGRIVNTQGLHRSISTDYTLTANDRQCFFEINASTGPKTLILPDAVTAGNGWRAWFGKSDFTNNAVTLLKSGINTIEQAFTRISLTTSLSRCFVGCDGISNFYVLSGNSYSVTGASVTAYISNWLNAVRTLGGDANSSRQSALTILLKTLESYGLLSALVYLIIYNATDGFSGCNVPLIRPAGLGNALLVNLVPGDRGDGGLIGSPGRYVGTLINPRNVITSVNSCTILQYHDLDPIHDNYYFGGVYTTPTISRFHAGWATDGITSVENGIGSFFVAIPPSDPTGLILATRRSATDFEIYINGASVAQSSSPNTETLPMNGELFSLALNANGSPISNNVGVRASMFAVINAGVTSEEVAILNDALTACHASLKAA